MSVGLPIAPGLSLLQGTSRVSVLPYRPLSIGTISCLPARTVLVTRTFMLNMPPVSSRKGCYLLFLLTLHSQFTTLDTISQVRRHILPRLTDAASGLKSVPGHCIPSSPSFHMTLSQWPIYYKCATPRVLSRSLPLIHILGHYRLCCSCFTFCARRRPSVINRSRMLDLTI